MNLDLVFLQQQIQDNCHISDANFSGAFSLCGLLLRLRDLYKWEAGLPPWEEPEQQALMAWIDAREELWLQLEGRECRVLRLAEETIEPFEAAEVNQAIAPSGLLYGAGCVIGMKPSFFLARPVRSVQQEGLWVHTVEQELARDIFTTPVMRQGDQIIARRQAMAALLWDMVLEQRASVAPALDYALSGYGLDQQALLKSPGAFREPFLRMAYAELEVLVHHEIGEAGEDVFPAGLWHEMVETHKQTLVEIFLRSVKDLLADTHPRGLLGHVIAAGKDHSLALYLAMMRPIARVLFPEMGQALARLADGPDWAGLERLRRAGYRKGRDLALRLVELHVACGTMAEPGRVQDRIVEEVIRPLGILGLTEDGDPSGG